MQLDPLRLGQGEAGAPGQQDQRLLPPVELHAVEVQRDPCAVIDSDGEAQPGQAPGRLRMRGMQVGQPIALIALQPGLDDLVLGGALPEAGIEVLGQKWVALGQPGRVIGPGVVVKDKPNLATLLATLIRFCSKIGRSTTRQEELQSPRPP